MSLSNRIHIGIHDFDCGLDEISVRLGLTPTDAWLKGDLIANRHQPVYRKKSGWMLQSPLAPECTIDQHIDFMLAMLQPCQIEFKAIADTCYAELAIVSFIKNDFNPGIHLTKSQIQQISALGLEIDFDLYIDNNLDE